MIQMIVVSALTLILDRVIKIAIDKYLILNVKNVVIDNFLYITKCYNEGAAFNIFNGNTIFLICASIFALVMLFKYIKSNKLTTLNKISYGLLIGGIFGNLIDRIFLGHVIDYVNFIIFNHEFAIFNLADCAIVIGAILIILDDWGDKDAKRNNS